MKATKDGFKDRQLHIEDYLQMVSAEQGVIPHFIYIQIMLYSVELKAA